MKQKNQKKKLFKKDQVRKATPYEEKSGNYVFRDVYTGQLYNKMPQGYSVIINSEKSVDEPKDEDYNYGHTLPELVVERPTYTQHEKEVAEYARTNLPTSTIEGIDQSKWEDQRGFFGNIRDALNVTNTRNDSNQPWYKRFADKVFWELDSKNPSGGLEGVLTNPAVLVASSKGLLSKEALKYLALGIGTNLSTYPIVSKTAGQYVGDQIPILTNTQGDLLVTGLSPLVKSYGQNVTSQIYNGVQSRVQGIKDFNTMLNTSKEEGEFAFYPIWPRNHGYVRHNTTGERLHFTTVDATPEYIDANNIWGKRLLYNKNRGWSIEAGGPGYYPIVTWPETHPNQMSFHIPPLTNQGKRELQLLMRKFVPGTQIGEIRYNTPSSQALARYNSGKNYISSLKPFILNRDTPVASLSSDVNVQPYSLDSYMQLLSRAARNPERYYLRYFQKPMTSFNDEGLSSHGIERYAGIKGGSQTIQPNSSQLNLINQAIQRMNLNAKPATIENGQLQIPYPYLFVK